MVVAQLLAETQLADGHLDAPDRQLTVGKQNLQAAIGSSRFRLRLRHVLAHLDNAAELPQRTIGRFGGIQERGKAHRHTRHVVAVGDQRQFLEQPWESL